jgi:hypothetical protein
MKVEFLFMLEVDFGMYRSRADFKRRRICTGLKVMTINPQS